MSDRPADLADSGAQLEPASPEGEGQGAPALRPRRRLRFRARRAHRPRSRFFRICALTIEILIGVIALLLVLSAFLFWRLVDRPISLDFLTPLLVQAFDAQTAVEGSAEITGTRLLWDEQRQSLELQVTGLRVDDAEGEQSFSLPLANIDFSVAPLLEGKVEVTDLDLVGARLTMRRDPDQGFEVLLLHSSAERAERVFAPDERRTRQEELTDPTRTPRTAPQEANEALLAINALLSDRDLGPLSDLQSVSLVNSEIVVDDRVLGFTWILPADLIILRRSPEGLTGEIDLSLPLGGHMASADLAFIYDKTSGTLDVAGQIGDLNLARLTTLLPQVQGLAVLESELNGDISATLAEEGSLFFVDFELTAGQGLLRPAAGGIDPVPIRTGAINGRIDLAEAKLTIYDSHLATGTEANPGPVITSRVSLERAEADTPLRRWRLKFEAEASSFAVNKLSWLWPSVYGANAHDWVTQNITAGMVSDLHAALSFDLGAEGASNQSISGSFGYSGLTLTYLEPLPPLLGLGGVARVEDDRLIFEVLGGNSQGLTLGPGLVTLYDLADDLPKILIESPVAGSLSNMLSALNQPGLALISRTGIEQRGVQGEGRVDVTLGFPLLNDLDAPDIALTAKGNFTEVLMPDLVLGQDISGRAVAVDADMRRLIVTGDAAIAGSRFQARYRQDYSGALSLEARSDRIAATTLAALVPPSADRVSEHFAGRFTITGNPSRRLTIDVDADLTDASLTQPLIDWQKPPGEAASLKGKLDVEAGALRHVRDVSLSAPGFQAAGAFDFNAESVFTQARLSRAAFKNYDLRDIVIDEMPDRVHASIGGGTIDARPWIKDGALPNVDPEERLEEVDAPQRADLTLQNLDRIILPAGSLQNVRGSATNIAGDMGLDLAAQLVEGNNRGALDLVFGPHDGGHRADIEVSNLGALLRALDLYDELEGGQLSWKASAPPGPGMALSGALSGENLYLTTVPEGVTALVSGPGLTIDRLTAGLTIQGSKVQLDDLRAVGSDIAVTANGSLDSEADTIDLRGRVIPAYALNDFLNQIPILGWVVTGGENQGLFAISYAISGALRDPRIVINPLSAVTPPILRSFVELLADGTRLGGGKPSTSMEEPPGPMR
ncbi:MAG: AsmA-like C-terminal domain-containing protein [Pseudomonadota bacterium]